VPRGKEPSPSPVLCYLSKDRVEENRHRHQRNPHHEGKKCTPGKPGRIGGNEAQHIHTGKRFTGNERGKHFAANDSAQNPKDRPQK